MPYSNEGFGEYKTTRESTPVSINISWAPNETKKFGIGEYSMRVSVSGGYSTLWGGGFSDASFYKFRDELSEEEKMKLFEWVDDLPELEYRERKFKPLFEWWDE